jgi:DNA-binding NtrC family response regulator
VQYVRIAAHPIFDEAGALLYISESMHTCAHSAELAGSADASEMVGQSRMFNHVVGHLCAAAESDAPILLTGETGSGKELAARLIHRKSARAARPFVPLDCTVLTQELCADELFGHEKGAFTGCAGAKPGLFDVAHRGTLFLDEIGDMPPAIQAKLLRVLETGTYRRVGGTDLQKVDVRLICATNRDLRAMVAEGRFRADLYYRIACVHLEVPPLRHRREDIPELVRHFLAQRAPAQGITPAAMALLAAYDYPGNVRELANVVDRARILARDTDIDVAHLPAELQGTADRCVRRDPVAARINLGDTESIRDALTRFEGNRRRAASWLGLSERTLYRRLRQIQADT